MYKITSHRTPHTAHRIPLTALCFLLFFSAFAQQPYIDLDEQAQNRMMSMSVQNCDYYNFNPTQILRIHNKYQIPAFSLYNNLWDTLYIRSEQIEIPFFDNQLKIILLQEGNRPFAFPVSGVVSTGYVKNKGRQHTGIDFTVQKNEPVVSCFDGVVRIAKKFEEYGNTVVIRHYNGLETVYALLDNVCVVHEQKVNAGELIGYVSNANPTKRNVLHFEIRFLNEFFNPEKVINFNERKLLNNIVTLTPADFQLVPIVKPNPPVIQDISPSDSSSSKEQLLNTPKNMPTFHTIQSGETIYSICTKYNISEQQLRSLNNIKGNHIEVGQRLRIQ